MLMRDGVCIYILICMSFFFCCFFVPYFFLVEFVICHYHYFIGAFFYFPFFLICFSCTNGILYIFNILQMHCKLSIICFWLKDIFTKKKCRCFWLNGVKEMSFWTGILGKTLKKIGKYFPNLCSNLIYPVSFLRSRFHYKVQTII